MDNLIFVKDYLKASIEAKQKIASCDSTLSSLIGLADRIVGILREGNKVLLAGNGGSAADAQHIAGEFVSRFFFDRPGLPAIALTTDSSILTAIGNDYGFEHLFSRQVQAHGQPGDVFIGISTSGNSVNIINAVRAAKEKGLFTAVFCGDGGALREEADLVLGAYSSCTPHIQEAHITLGHILCALIEEKIFGEMKAYV